MAGRDDRTLEKRINEITKGLAIEQLGTTSDPLSYQINCYQKLGERACATTAINLLAGTANQFVCTDEQASELEKLWLNSIPKNGVSSEPDDRAVLQRMRSMRTEIEKMTSQKMCDQS